MKRIYLFLISTLFSFNVFASGSVLIDGKLIKTKDDLHNVLAKGLNFPKFYGKNLDALYDILVTDLVSDSIIKFKNINILKSRLGTTYVQDLLEAISEASEENPRIVLLLE